jgi:hypothetical protein
MLTQDVKQIRDRFVQAFPVPQKQSGESSIVWEERARQWTLKLIRQVAFSTGDARWGSKRAGPGRPLSKDAMAFNGPPLVCYDMLVGTGTGTPKLATNPSPIAIPGQIFEPVLPANALAPPVPPAPPVPEPPITPAPEPPVVVAPPSAPAPQAPQLPKWLRILVALYKATR